MTLFIHVGLPKTGTTSIQMTLFENRDYLGRECSIHYPDFSRNHWRIALPFLGEVRFGKLERAVSKTGKSRQHLHKLATKDLSELERELPRFGHTFISSEHLSGMPKSMAKRLRHHLESLDEGFRVIVYVRHPGDYYSSIIQQSIKMGGRRLSEIADIQIDYEKTFRRLVSVYGKERLVVRSFSPARFVNNDLIDDFFAATVGDTPVGLKKVRRNESLSTPAVLLMDRINGMPEFEGARRDPIIRRLEKIEGEKFRLPRAYVEKFVSESAELISYLSSEFEITFDEFDLNKFPESISREFPPETLDSIAGMIGRKGRIKRNKASQGRPGLAKALLGALRSL